MKPTHKYELIVTFNEYTGNFHREFNAFVLGVASEYMDNQEKTLSNAIQDLTTTLINKDNEDVESALDDATDELMDYYHHFHDEYGMNVSELTQVKNAKGKHECNGITVFFDKDPANIMPIILKRIAAFPVAATLRFAPNNLKVLKVEFVKETITREVKEIDFE